MLGMAMATLFQALDQGLGANPFDRRFAGGVNIGHQNDISVVEAGAEFFEQVVEARVAMWLHDGDHLAEPVAWRAAFQHRLDLDRVMTVIVDHDNTLGFAGLGEAPLDAAEAGEAFRRVTSSTPISVATAIAARLFCTLCWPTIGNFTASISRLVSRNRSVITTTKVGAVGIHLQIEARTSLLGRSRR